MSNKQYWDKLRAVPSESLKKITGGRLKGMNQICPQWRYSVMTDVFGPVGIGWKFEIISKDIVDGVIDDAGNSTKFIFIEIALYVCIDNKWSEPIPGCGGADVIVKEKYGLYTNTEAVKMALTDALGAAMKLLGVAADVYSGTMDDTKYNDTYIDYTTQRKCQDIFDQVKGGLNSEQASWCMDMMKRHKYREVVEYLNGNK
jgi:hypothetical protein